MGDEARIPLAGVIGALRAELLEAVRAGENEDIRFALGTVDLEFHVAVEKKHEGSGGIKFWIMSVGVGGSSSIAETQTVKLSLTPTRTTPEGDHAPVIVGSAQALRPT